MEYIRLFCLIVKMASIPKVVYIGVVDNSNL